MLVQIVLNHHKSTKNEASLVSFPKMRLGLEEQLNKQRLWSRSDPEELALGHLCRLWPLPPACVSVHVFPGMRVCTRGTAQASPNKRIHVSPQWAETRLCLRNAAAFFGSDVWIRIVSAVCA